MMIFCQIRGWFLKNPHLVVGEIGQKLEIVYHCYILEKTRFLEDLFRQTKAPRALQGGQIRGVAFTSIETQCPYRNNYSWRVKSDRLPNVIILKNENAS